MKRKRKSITFLLLHLGYGGIESATINSANALIEDYDVNIVSFYNLKNNQSTKLDNRISIKYLYDGEPNREAFKEAVSKRNIINILKEGFKAVDILMKKKNLVIKEIINNQSDALVSTTVAFSPLLSKYGKNETIKIAQEHHHHNNNLKYINKLKNKYTNIDYLCALTNTLKTDYEKFLENNTHTKVILLPNMLVNYPSKISDLKNSLVSVGRLDKSKRIDELVKAFSKIDNKKTKLYIIGDGAEYNNIKNLITELELEKRVIMLGYLSHKEQEQYLLKARAFLMTSISEGLPMVLLEAMSYGIPCIAYQTDSGISDIIDNEKNGFVINDRNEIEYVEKLNKIIDDDKLTKKLSDKALKKSVEFNQKNILKIWNKML